MKAFALAMFYGTLKVALVACIPALILLNEVNHYRLTKKHCSPKADEGPVLYSVYDENGVTYLSRTRNEAYFSCLKKIKSL